MKILSHRGLWSEASPQNSLASFAASQAQHIGIETDLRSYQGKLYLSHDPLNSPADAAQFGDLMGLWKRSPELPLFLNIKEDGLLSFLEPFSPLLQKLNVVFFDMSVPQLVQFSKVFPKNMLATRFSEYEQEPSALDLCSWLWVDSFNVDPDVDLLRSFALEKKLSLAVVSPDLHRRDPKPIWSRIKNDSDLSKASIYFCTDLPLKFLKELS